MSTETNPTPAADSDDGWSSDWLDDLTGFDEVTDPADVGQVATPILTSEACRLLDDTEFYAVEDLGSEGTGESRMVPRTDEETAAKVRLSATYAAIATAEAVEALDTSLNRQTDVLTELTQHAVGGLVILGDAAHAQAAFLAEIARTAQASRRDAIDQASAVVDAEYADSASRAGCWSVGALVLAVWAAIGGPRPDWSWLPQNTLPGWLAGAFALVGIALAIGGAAITVLRYGEARYRWSIRG
ncbi:hypothetical protein [Cryptosporangium phraense]|uniref:Uncharacterized protein n=1 Tax=Cryptosporangium phraense TaxID=2593070 RepID=A0A545AR68_9ACTN|nr:hypothetical protein [Cryptosporangium phraense]TQS43731.1 hypothetical protein FL583_16980 [Cryptosporangium phraense]